MQDKKVVLTINLYMHSACWLTAYILRNMIPSFITAQNIHYKLAYGISKTAAHIKGEFPLHAELLSKCRVHPCIRFIFLLACFRNDI